MELHWNQINTLFTKEMWESIGEDMFPDEDCDYFIHGISVTYNSIKRKKEYTKIGHEW